MSDEKQLSVEQQNIADQIFQWLSSPKLKDLKQTNQHFLTVGGYAGTGKTFLISQISKILLDQGNNVSFCAYTGKASNVLKNRIEPILGNSENYTISTIHSLIYRPRFEKDDTGQSVMVGWERKDMLPCDVIIIDEASMVSGGIWNDLLMYKKPIICVGDHGQLPPVGDDYNIMATPVLKLNEIHRQALDSPIIQASIHIREKGNLPYGSLLDGVFKLPWADQRSKDLFDTKITWDKDVICLCGFNSTRVELNKRIRNILNYEGEIPQLKERVICLKNNHSTGLMNGQMGTVKFMKKYRSNLYNIYLDLDDDRFLYNNLVCVEGFNKESTNGIKFPSFKGRKKDIDIMEFGYCISVHKSQGSEWPRVVVFEERNNYWTPEYYKRWLYTAVTRAKEKLVIFDSYH